ncbi:MAG: M20 family dipeptidase, partial [bacterium]|nr:M20 family dipeptidase [bacterium]
GVYGGVAPNPLQAIAEIVTALKDRDGHILSDGFCDRVLEPSETEKAAWGRLPFDEAEYRAKEVRVDELVGEPEYSVIERTWTRPTLEVHGIRGGFTGDGAKTVIPAQAVAKLSMRLVADQQPDEASRQFEEAVAKVCPRGVTAEWKAINKGAPSLIDPGNRFIRASAEAMEQVFGKPTVYIRSGGSIPI